MVEIAKVKPLDCDLEKCVMSGPLSRETTFVLHVRGPYGVDECQRIIEMLELQKAWIARPNIPSSEAA